MFIICDDSLTDIRIYREASREFGEKVASRLKLTKDGSKVLWPQPLDDPEDPQNVSPTRHIPVSKFLQIVLVVR